MNKHVVAIGVLLIAACVLEHERSKLARKMALKELECDAYKLGMDVFKHLYEEGQKTEEKEA